MSNKLWILQLAGAVALTASAVDTARAHFILLEPSSYVDQDQAEFAGGAPQKGGPCGPGGNDDVQPVPENGEVTTVRAGDVLSVKWKTTVPHLGYFRIALAEDRADFVDPVFDDPVQCSYDMASVKTGAHGNVLMDGIDFAATEQDITIPDMPCEQCTLQIMQVMKDHGPPECIYYHCANLKILPREGSGSASDGGGPGAPVAGDAADEEDDSGCAVSSPGARCPGAGWLLGAVGFAALAVRQRRPRNFLRVARNAAAGGPPPPRHRLRNRAVPS